ncbi:glycosyltransferase family 2 protein [Clostridium perfringens]|uniref:glycosyltransferase family 2 protein n=2 Tax=Clostridium perfringens TaxID=1502 RepID=UPI00291401F3|nr:glycosyltransferase family 2 protein [Clostridium perfringens]MDU6932581.1 glycosyltransferase family 2 protein [Clostridium perfringens]
MNPLVSVVMSVYNGEKYLNESIESILNQTYKNFEFIIINDGSTDKSLKIIENYSIKDKRIILIDNIVNKGLIYSLNKGIEKSKGKYIVRMDADDISLENRIKEQVKFMEENKEIALSGTAQTIFLDGAKILRKKMSVLTKHDSIKSNSMFDCSFVHPSIIMRSSIIKKENFRYKEKYKYAEDFGLWSEIIPKYKVANINKQLIKYRLVKNSITREANKNMKQREEVFKKIFKNYFNELGLIEYKLNEDIHYEISMIQNLSEFKYTLEEKSDYLNQICNNFIIEDIKRNIALKYLKCCIYQGNFNDYKKSEFYKIEEVKYIEYLKYKIISNIKKNVKKFFK